MKTILLAAAWLITSLVATGQIIQNPVTGDGDGITDPAAFRAAIKTQKIYNVKDYGATGNGVLLRTAAMTSGSAVLTCSGGSFVAADVGKRIIVRRAGTNQTDSATNTNQLDLVGTIIGYTSATTVTLSATAGNTVSGEDVIYGTDDTTAIQAAITAAHTAGGGVVYLPTAIYFVDGAAQDTGISNCILRVPATLNNIAIEIRGDEPIAPNFSFVETSFVPETTYGGTVLLRTASHTGRLIGGSDEGVGTTFGGFNSVHLRVSKLTVRGYNGAEYTAIGGKYFAYLSVEDVMVDVGTSHPMQIAEPPSTSVAFECPQQYNAGISDLRNCWAMGVYTGYLFSEHTNLDNVSSLLCVNGMVAQKGDYNTYIGRFLYHWCKNGISSTGGLSQIYMASLSAEYYTLGGARVNRWFNRAYDINDTSDYLQGQIQQYQIISSGGSGSPGSLTVLGGRKLLFTPQSTPDKTINQLAFYPANATVTGGSKSSSTDANQVERFGGGQGVNVITAPVTTTSGWSWPNVWVPAGPCRLTICAVTNSNYGITTWKVAGVSIGTVDNYSASLVYNVVSTVDFTNKTAGYKTITATMETKNASATDYYWGWSTIKLSER